MISLWTLDASAGSSSYSKLARSCALGRPSTAAQWAAEAARRKRWDPSLSRCLLADVLCACSCILRGSGGAGKRSSSTGGRPKVVHTPPGARPAAAGAGPFGGSRGHALDATLLLLALLLGCSRGALPAPLLLHLGLGAFWREEHAQAPCPGRPGGPNGGVALGGVCVRAWGGAGGPGRAPASSVPGHPGRGDLCCSGQYGEVPMGPPLCGLLAPCSWLLFLLWKIVTRMLPLLLHVDWARSGLVERAPCAFPCKH